MFDAAGKAGKLAVQLVYFRGFGECRASKFVTDTAALTRLMSGIDCRGGHTQIGKVLAHALKANADQKVNALVYIGDAMEEADRRPRRQGRRSGPARRAGLRLPGGSRPGCRGCLQGDCAAVARRLVPLRPECGGDACKAPGDNRRLCHRRFEGVGSAWYRGGPAADSASGRALTMSIGALVLLLLLVLALLAGVHACRRPDLRAVSAWLVQWFLGCSAWRCCCSVGPGMGGMALSAALAWFGSSRLGRGTARTPGSSAPRSGPRLSRWN